MVMRTLKFDNSDPEKNKELATNVEWIVTNGLGGYASNTISGKLTRRFHGYLIASLPAPYGRTMVLNDVKAEFIINEKLFLLDDEEGIHYLKEFYLENGLPVWKYEIEGNVIEKRIITMHLQNTTYIKFKLIEGSETLKLNLRIYLHMRPHEGALGSPIDKKSYTFSAKENRFEILYEKLNTSLKLYTPEKSSEFSYEDNIIPNVFYPLEFHRGYESHGDLLNIGNLKTTLDKKQDTVLIASTEPWKHIESLNAADAFKLENERRERLLQNNPELENIAKEFVLASDQFVVKPVYRELDEAKFLALGDEMRSVIAGYHWFTDWGRDTMISLEGLTLCTGRYDEAKWILRTFSRYVWHGLIPNMFPEGEHEGLYHTADATLWYFHAIDKYMKYTKDDEMIKFLIPTLVDIIQFHMKGTHFGIHVDKDGLLIQGAENFQLTWMDAKVKDWVVTPRRGKAVEINALWYNSLRLMEEWMLSLNRIVDANMYGQLAKQTFQSFNDKFWFQEGGYLCDIVDDEKGMDLAIRPNQLFAISLKYPVLDEKYWKKTLECVERKLLTPYGLRTLSQDHPDYKKSYDGDLFARDSAYHQGTVWPWLIGPFIDSWLKVNAEEDPHVARKYLNSFENHLSDFGIGTISEICDPEPPYAPRGCISQAWSIAEVLRCWLKTK